MASTEDKAYEIMRELDVDYVLVIFGGLTGYSSDGKYMHTILFGVPVFKIRNQNWIR
jgi:dolichyl-diphosphooligosaccharide--protein glycosyltransferase